MPERDRYSFRTFSSPSKQEKRVGLSDLAGGLLRTKEGTRRKGEKEGAITFLCPFSCKEGREKKKRRGIGGEGWLVAVPLLFLFLLSLSYCQSLARPRHHYQASQPVSQPVFFFTLPFPFLSLWLGSGKTFRYHVPSRPLSLPRDREKEGRKDLSL